MDTEKFSDSKEVIPYKSKPLEEIIGRYGSEEKIRIFEPEKRHAVRRLFFRAWSLLAVTIAFAALFVCIYYFYYYEEKSMLENTIGKLLTEPTDITVAASPDDECADHAKKDKQIDPPLIIDESKTGIDITPELTSEYTLAPLISSTEGVKVIIIHSHNSECVSESVTVFDAGEAIAQILNSAGITTLHCDRIHDGESSIGSYKRMNESLKRLISENPSAICVIDLHDSDSGLPITFTIATASDYAWQENLKLAAAIYGKLDDVGGAFRFLPVDLGQNNGLLSVNLGIGGRDCDDLSARRAVAAFSEAFIEICNKGAAAEE